MTYGSEHMGKVPGACDCRRKRGCLCHACATAHDASTLCTVPQDLRHGQASRHGLHATPWWQAPACVAPLPPPAKQRELAVSEALHPSINAAGWRQCRRQTGFSQLTSPQHNPQEWVISLNATLNTEAETHRHSHLRCTASCAKIVSVVADRGVIVLDAPPRRFTAAAARKKWEPGCLRACACCAVSPRAPDAGGAQAGRAWCDVARLCQGTGGGVTGTPI